MLLLVNQMPFQMKNLIILPFLCLVVASCTPMRLVRLEPTAEFDSYRYGEKIVVAENSQARVEASYYDSSPEFIVFNLEVENTGTEAFNFDPTDCKLVPDVGPVRPAVDPEMQLVMMDTKSLKQTRSAEALGFLEVGVALATTVAGITSENVEGEGNFTNDFLIATAVANATTNLAFTFLDASSNQDIARNAIPLQGQVPTPENRYFWLDHAVRLTTVKPGQRIFGKVAFERNDEASVFSFNVVVAGEEFQFPFDQKVIEPNN